VISSARSNVLTQLRALECAVIARGDADYDSARAVFYGGIDRHPAAVVRPRSAAEVARVITTARETHVPLAIKSGGHSLSGHSVVEDGIVLDLSAMRTFEVDVERRTAWVQAGSTTGAYTQAAAAHGLATGFGDTATVGIGGLTLGGGVGFLTRKHGLTVDDLLAAEVVTADGQVVEVSADSHADLFWAIRGGGGNFGVATRFQFRLHELPSIVGGMVMFPATAEVIERLVGEAEAAPDELTTIINVMKAPPMPMIPAEHHGKLLVMAFLVYAGPTEPGLRAVAPFRTAATPLADMVRPMTYPEMFPPDQGFHPIAVVRTMFADRVDRGTLEALLEKMRQSTAMMAAAQFRVLGGAAGRVPVDATAYAHRGRRMMINVATMFQQPGEAPLHRTWVEQAAAILPCPDTSAYVNFIGAEGGARVRDAYPGPTWERLRAVKRRYDPTNLFRLNQNIAPAD
jgi:FAD/FMN-containing dehydrogenase